MRTFITWAAVLVVLGTLSACITEPASPKPVPKVTISAEPEFISGADGDTVVLRAYATPDLLNRPVSVSSGDTAVASVLDTLIILRNESASTIGTTLTLSWTDGVRVVIKTIPVSVAPSPYVTFTVRVGTIAADSLADLSALSARIAWRLPWRDSVNGPIKEGVATFSILREIAEVMDSVTVSVWGSEGYLPMSMNFRLSYLKDGWLPADAVFTSFINEMKKIPVSSSTFSFILVSKAFTPFVGIGAGQAVTVSPVALYTPDRYSSRGWMNGIPFTNSNWQSYVDSLPLRVCADESVAGSVADSVAFWGSVSDSLNARTGKVWFVPASTNCRAYWGVNPNLSGVRGQVNSKNGLPFVELKYWPHERNSLDLGAVIPHEFIHLIGFGHTLGWVSVMSVDGEKSLSVTAMDNAMLHLFYELRLAEKRMGGAISVEATRQWLIMRNQWPSGWRLNKAAADAVSVSHDYGTAVTEWRCH